MLGRSAEDEPEVEEKESAPDVSGSGYYGLGAGLCRGDNWQSGKIWPKFEVRILENFGNS